MIESDEIFWKDPQNQTPLWQEFFKEYNYTDISSGVIRSITAKLLCNEAKNGVFNDPSQSLQKSKNRNSSRPKNFGGIFVGRLDADSMLENKFFNLINYIK